MNDAFTPPPPLEAPNTHDPDSQKPPHPFGFDTMPPPTLSGKPPKRRGRLRTWFQHLSKKQKLIVGAIFIGLLIASGVITAIVLAGNDKAEPPRPAQKAQEEKKRVSRKVPSPLTGIPVLRTIARMPTTGVMIENSPDARPQSGLYDAGVVYEAIAEGGITRFLALYQEAQPTSIGPVRSVRPYYLDFLAPFDAPIAHAGGSGAALARLASGGFRDLEAFQNEGAYQRVSHRYAPHNLYTSRAALLNLQNSKGWRTSRFTGFPRKAESKPKRVTAKSVDLRISDYGYNVHYDYQPATNRYVRSMGGQPHMDAHAKRQIAPKVVVALVMPHSYDVSGYSVYGTVGRGTAYFFQDGRAMSGTWYKPTRTSQVVFRDARNRAQPLNPGQTWITLVTSPSAITYRP